MNSKNIIVDYGSSHLVNCIFCKNKNILILNPNNLSLIVGTNIILQNIIESNNRVTILNDYNCYDDIAKYII
jgi:hypothetical protein